MSCKPYYKIYKQANSKKDLKENKPMLSWLKDKKMVVLANKEKESKVIHFGNTDYDDFTTHCDVNRRKNYLSRSAGITDKNGKLTKDNIFSANFWARIILW